MEACIKYGCSHHIPSDLHSYLRVLADSFLASRVWGPKVVFDLCSFKRSMMEIP